MIVIVGPTASGKTSLAIDLARLFGGEIISADSRSIYKGLDVGTAKPTAEEIGNIPYWGIDLVEPGQRYSTKDFQDYAHAKIAEIKSRNNIPFLVGGTGLYINSVIYNYGFADERKGVLARSELEKMSLEELYYYCYNNNIELPENYKNSRYVINTILRDNKIYKSKYKQYESLIIVGITTEKIHLIDNINKRAQEIVSDEVWLEAKKASAIHGWDNEAMTGNIYQLAKKYSSPSQERQKIIDESVLIDKKLAKRQMTWFRRDPNIIWLTKLDAYTYLARAIENLNKQ